MAAMDTAVALAALGPRAAVWLALVFAAQGCAAEPSSIATPVHAAALVGGEPTDLTGFVHITHARGDRTCTGTLIAPTLVLTAKHCIVHATSEGERALTPDGFRIGFGPSVGELELRSAETVTWVGAPEDVSIDGAVDAGEDLALIGLSDTAPRGEQIYDVDLSFFPVDGQEVRLAGYGLTDPIIGASGTRTLGRGTVEGFDPETGVVQIVGDSACYGDSGGPVLAAETARVLGVVNQVGNGGDGGRCDLGFSFAGTTANERVRRLIARECARVGGCGPRAMGADAGSALDASFYDADSGDALDMLDGSTEPDASFIEEGGTLDSDVDHTMPSSDAGKNGCAVSLTSDISHRAHARFMLVALMSLAMVTRLRRRAAR
jgi:hypothetical protein